MIRYNLIDVDTYSFVTKISSPEIKKIKNFNGSYSEFFYQHLSTNQPCIIEHASKNWKCVELWVKDNKPNITYLEFHYGNAIVPVTNCNETYFNSHTKSSMTFSEFAKYWNNMIQNNYPTSEPCLYLKDWHFTRDFPNENIYSTPPEFSNDWLNEYLINNVSINDDYRFVYMGPKGSWTPFHVDVFTSYSWSINLCGIKKWILLPPGEENKLRFTNGKFPHNISYLNSNNSDFESTNTNIKYYIIIQKAGEAIFVPSGWYHQVWNMEDTISINHNWINSSNINNMWLSMKKNLSDVKNEIIEFKNSMEDWENHCQLLLKSDFGMNFQEFYQFLIYVIKTRLSCLKHKKEHTVYGEWLLGKNCLKFDLEKALETLNIFLNDYDTKLLEIFKLRDHM